MDNTIKEHIAKLTKFLEDCGTKISPLPKVVLRKDVNESSNFLGKTGYYEPENQSIVLYTAGRHPKDIVRSYAHELYHHHQNLNGNLKQAASESADPKYAQNSKALRRIEAEAYMKGNLWFRDYCDSVKYK